MCCTFWPTIVWVIQFLHALVRIWGGPVFFLNFGHPGSYAGRSCALDLHCPRAQRCSTSFAIRVSSSVDYFFHVSCPFSNWILWWSFVFWFWGLGAFFFYWVWEFFISIHTGPLSDLWFENIFSRAKAGHVILLMDSFEEQKNFFWMKSSLLIFIFMGHTIGIKSKDSLSCLVLGPEHILLFFFYESFMVLEFTCKCVIHFEFLVYEMWDFGWGFFSFKFLCIYFFCLWMSNYFTIICRKDFFLWIACATLSNCQSFSVYGTCFVSYSERSSPSQ